MPANRLTSIAQTAVSCIAALLLASAAHASKPDAVAKTQIKPRPASKELDTKQAVAQAKPAPKAAPAPVVDDLEEEKPGVAGTYLNGDNLLTIVRYTRGKPDEHLITFIPDTKKFGGQYCAFLGSQIISAGTKQFDVQRYTNPQLPVTLSECNMRVKADGARAEITEMSNGCQSLCGDAQTIPNPGILKRKLDN